MTSAPRGATAGADEDAERLRARGSSNGWDEIVLPALPDVPGQIGAAECRYLYWLTARTFTGRGAVVEVGSWLGRSALHLAAGLRDGGRAGRLFCLDRFEWDEKQPLRLDPPLAQGDDTLPLFRKHVAASGFPVEAHKGELEDFSWDGGAIEILFLDAPKGHKPFVHALSTFSGSLLPDASLVASQDFGLPTAYAQPLCIGRLVDVLEPVHAVGQTAGFLVRERFPRDLRARLDRKRWKPAEDEAAFAAVVEALPDERFRARVRPGLALWFWKRGEEARARAHLRRHPPLEQDLPLWRRLAASPKKRKTWEGLFRQLGL